MSEGSQGTAGIQLYFVEEESPSGLAHLCSWHQSWRQAAAEQRQRCLNSCASHPALRALSDEKKIAYCSERNLDQGFAWPIYRLLSLEEALTAYGSMAVSTFLGDEKHAIVDTNDLSRRSEYSLPLRPRPVS